MTALLSCAYLYYWWSTYSSSEASTPAYRQRVWLTMATAGYLLLAGDVQTTLPGAIAEWLVLIEGIFILSRFNERDELLWGKRI